MPLNLKSRPLFEIARDSIEGNILRLNRGSFLAAGKNQFRGLWTRDFCFASRGLLALGHFDVVRDHLSLLLDLRRKTDHLIPRLIDSISPAWLRVAHHVGSKWVPLLPRHLPMGENLRPEFRSEHGVEAIDSNLLVLQTALAYVDVTGDLKWWKSRTPDLEAVFRYYERHAGGVLIRQGPFTDWQDSVRRDGHAFLTNLLFWDTARRLLKLDAFPVAPSLPERLAEEINRRFLDSSTGMYRSLDDSPHLSLDGNLFAIELGFGSANHESLYERIKAHPLWGCRKTGVPGRATYPDYPSDWKSFPTKLVRLHGYHDRIHWSWLMGFSAKTACLMGDFEEADRVLDGIERMAVRDGTIEEIHAAEPPHPPWRSMLYRSETGFSWGSGFIVDALAARGRSEPAQSLTPNATPAPAL